MKDRRKLRLTKGESDVLCFRVIRRGCNVLRGGNVEFDRLQMVDVCFLQTNEPFGEEFSVIAVEGDRRKLGTGGTFASGAAYAQDARQKEILVDVSSPSASARSEGQIQDLGKELRR